MNLHYSQIVNINFMKQVILNFLFLSFSVQYSSAQKIIEIGGEKIKTEMVNPSKFNIRGIWKIVDRKYFYDDGSFSRFKWDTLDKNNTVLISDSLFYACTYSITPNLIVSPIFKETVDTVFSTGGDFFEQFCDSALHISIWSKGDLEYSKNIKDPVATVEIWTLNNEYIAIAHANSFLYLERITDTNKKEGWKKQKNYEIVNIGNGHYIGVKTVFNTYQTEHKYIEYVFTPTSKCYNGSLQIYAPTERDFETLQFIGNKKIVETNDIGNKSIKGYIPLSQLQSKFFVVGYGPISPDCGESENNGEFLWRIVSDTTIIKKNENTNGKH